MVLLLGSPRIQGLSLKTLDLLSLRDTENHSRYSQQKEMQNQRNIVSVVTCPSTGDGEEPVVMVAGVKAERCRSCAEGTLRDGF